jgi:hypothetical protein
MNMNRDMWNGKGGIICFIWEYSVVNEIRSQPGMRKLDKQRQGEKNPETFAATHVQHVVRENSQAVSILSAYRNTSRKTKNKMLCCLRTKRANRFNLSKWMGNQFSNLSPKTCQPEIFLDFPQYIQEVDRLCGLVVRVPGYSSKGPGFHFLRYQILWEVVGLERGPLNLVRITEELLEWISSGCGPRKPRLTALGIRCADHATPSIHKFGINFADKRRSLDRYSSLEN